jgi:hypothetical protein
MKTKLITVALPSTVITNVPTDFKISTFTQTVFAAGVGAIGGWGTSHAPTTSPIFLILGLKETRKYTKY